MGRGIKPSSFRHNVLNRKKKRRGGRPEREQEMIAWRIEREETGARDEAREGGDGSNASHLEPPK